MTDTSTKHAMRPVIPHTMRLLAVPIILFWVGITVLVNVAVPQLEKVGEEHSAPMVPADAPSMEAMKAIGHDFREYDSNSSIMVVLEGRQALGDDAHRYYSGLVDQLSQDREHVQHVLNLWGDPLTAAGVQSSDGKAAYVMVNIAGDQGTRLANESVGAVREIVDRSTPPAGLKAYVTGPAALTDALQLIANASLAKITLFTLAALTLMFLLVYRSVVTAAIQLFMSLIALACSRGVIAVLGYHNVFGLTTFATNILTMLAIAAGTDYGIFLIGRYQEALRADEDHKTAYYTTFRGTAPVVLGSGLTIAGATYCLSFTHLPYFQTMGLPVAIGMVVVVVVALSLGPAVLTVCGRFGLLRPKGQARGRLWRRVGTAVVRWPAPILAASAAAVLVGMLALPGFKPGYNDRYYLPNDSWVNIGYAAADRHFSQARLNPDMLMVEADHDMRNPADMLVLDRVAKNVLRTVGVAMIQDITRPLGIPIQHSSIPFQISSQSSGQIGNLPYQKDRAADLLTQAGEFAKTIVILKQQYALQQQVAAATHDETQNLHETTATINELRDQIANFDDVFRPIRSYFYWEKHCFDIPICWAIRSLFDAIDGIDKLADQFASLTASLDKLDALQPQLLALIPPQIASQETDRALTLSNYATTSAIDNQTDALLQNATAMGQAFDTANNDDFFYLPPEAFSNPEFIRGLKMFLSPDGKAARFFVTQQGDPATPQGISLVDMERTAAQEGLKQSSLSGAKVYVGGEAATYKDMHDGEKYDLMIAAAASLTLIFMIMLILTRSLVAALVIVGTAASSIAASFALSVLIWQDLVGLRVYWVVQALAVIVLLAVGSDYNLLLVSRFKEEIHAGLKTGIVRSMAGTGGVVTAAGLVFAFTMASMVGSDMRAIGQFGSTVCVGLLLDTLIVRTLLMPSIATLLGRWFWWPQVVHRRGAPRQAAGSPARGPKAEVTTQPLGPGAMNLGERQ
jgi:putative drug exporter of the RND superfamily